VTLLAESSSIDPAFMGALVFALIALTGWFFQYKKDRREEEARHEPRATPALHHQFVTRQEFQGHVEDVGHRLDKIEQAGEARVIRIYDKIDQTSEKTVDRIIKLISEQKK
jgi:hypothetical protein